MVHWEWVVNYWGRVFGLLGTGRSINGDEFLDYWGGFCGFLGTGSWVTGAYWAGQSDEGLKFEMAARCFKKK